MFTGAINSTVRQFLVSRAEVFNNATVVVGCSGGFTIEAVITQHASPAAIHSNDVSLYSCALGGWLTGKPIRFEVADPTFEWLRPHFTSDTNRVAALMVLFTALEWERQRHEHEKRMWRNYVHAFSDLVAETRNRLEGAKVRVDSFFAGDVLDHFQHFDGDDTAIFCCYAPTYGGGYERMYTRLEQIFTWDTPTYPLLDDARRQHLLEWMRQRRYLWYDDRLLPDEQPVMEQRSGRRRTVYLYSNVIQNPAFFVDVQPGDLPKMRLAGSGLKITPKSQVTLKRIKTTELARFKDAFLSKAVLYGQGTWAFAVLVDGVTVGFLEYTPARYFTNDVYMMADFAVPGTPYRRLSKLVLMLAVAGETRILLERLSEVRQRNVRTTAFTDRPVSMKYRGVMKLQRRGQDDDGRPFLNYGAGFNDSTWQGVLAEWLKRHSSQRS